MIKFTGKVVGQNGTLVQGGRQDNLQVTSNDEAGKSLNDEKIGVSNTSMSMVLTGDAVGQLALGDEVTVTIDKRAAQREASK